MARAERLALIERIEELRHSKVLVYVLGDRPPVAANLGDDAVRPILAHLRALGPIDRLDLFLYSRGGAIDVPWRLNTAFRRVAKSWNALVPFRANSAATLLALGADEIVLGLQGELGPIDPIMMVSRAGPAGPVQDPVSVEDVMAYSRFIRERAGLSDQSSLTSAMSKLADRLDPVALGNVYRTHSHIRYVARHMLLSRQTTSGLNEQTVDTIVETLAERVYAHGHAVGLEEAKDIGLHAVSAPTEVDQVMWSLLTEYERELKIFEPLDPFARVLNTDQYMEGACTAFIESTWGCHEFGGTIEVTAQRQMPANLQVSLNVPIQLPVGADAAQLTPAVQEAIGEAQQTLMQQAQQAVQTAMRQQAPLTGVNLRVLDAAWRQTEPIEVAG